MREDYSGNGDAWSNFPHEHARSRVYRWGEDGICGVCDNHQYVCISFAFWNEKDDILKERLFGLTGHEGNHGEDVKEIYYYLDNTPTHSYMKYLYKYPQQKFPYKQLVEESSKRSREEAEFEIGDTGIFDDNRYFDIFIEMAKTTDEELLFRVTAYNRGPEAAPLHIIPQTWFRNTWGWGLEDTNNQKPIPQLSKQSDLVIKSKHWRHQDHYLQFSPSPGIQGTTPPHYNDNGLSNDIIPKLMFTNNETNKMKLYNVENDHDYVKDGFHEYIVDEIKDAINPKNEGTKAGAWFAFDENDGIPPGDFVTIRFKYTNNQVESINEYEFDKMIDKRQDEADDFYYKLCPLPISDELRSIQRQAWSGMLWTKQFYHFIHSQWLKGDPVNPSPPAERFNIRNRDWKHLHIEDILSMPDKWEYPFFAAWDTAFHCIPFAMIDPEFAKKQLDIMTREWYMHPNGQIPAYEWNFSDVNPPVHAWATFRVFKIERKLYGKSDLKFLERVFQKLLLNFTWWVNRKDLDGKNIFEGGFLGLDNIGIFNRSEPLPTGGTLEQADSTGWMAFFCLQMLNISLELSKHNSVYEDIASKFFEHFLFISDAMSSLWNEADGFYYDSISYGGGISQPLPVKSLVGLIPLYACLTLEPQVLNNNPSFSKRLKWFLEHRKGITERNLTIANMNERGHGERMLLSIVNKHRLEKILQKLLDEDEFLSDYGIRSLSKYHLDHPYSMDVNGQNFNVEYISGESDSGLFGGNSNWRGPIWFPTTFLLIESLQRFYMYFGNEFKVECPTNSGNFINLAQVAENLQHRLIGLFQLDEDTNKRPYSSDHHQFENDEYFKDYIRFNEYFDGDSGKGLGSEHQCGWTALVAKLIFDTGISCTLPKTPKTPITTAQHYFDEELIERGRRSSIRLKRRMSWKSRSSGSSDFEDNSGQDDDEEDDQSQQDITEYVRKSLEGYQVMDDYHQELEINHHH